MRFVILFFFTVVIVYCSAFPTPPNPMVPSAVIRRIDELEQEEPPHPQWNTISAMKYFGKFGYMSQRKMKSQLGSLIDLQTFSKAIRKFQRMFNLEQTGELDEATQRMMSLPRCGVKDSPRSVLPRRKSRSRALKGMKSRSKRYVLQGGRWRKTELKYFFLNYTPDLTKSQVQIAIKRAFELWENVANVKFERTDDSRAADIKISFRIGDHDDYFPFDGQGGELAHAYYPSDGRVHFDDDELFSFEGNNRRGIDLFTVAAHEFGHTLGLSHSGVYDSLMAPTYSGYKPDLALHTDDILAVQQLYGKRNTPRREDKPEYDGNYLCRNTQPIDAMHYDWHDRAFYVFLGGNFWKVNEDGIMEGFPKKIKHHWKGLPDNIDASFYSQTTRRTYFFKGNKIWRYNDRKMLEGGFPQPSSALGLPTRPDAAVQLRRDAMVYVFKNGYYYQFSEYQRYNGDNYYGVRLVEDRWENAPTQIDAAMRKADGNVYFIKNDDVWGFSSGGSTLNGDNPRSFRATWLKCKRAKLLLQGES